MRGSLPISYTFQFSTFNTVMDTWICTEWVSDSHTFSWNSFISFFFSVDFSWPTSIWWLSFYASVFYFLMLFFCYFLDTCSFIIIGRSRVDPNGRKGGRKNLEEEMEGELSLDYIVWEMNLCLIKRGIKEGKTNKKRKMIFKSYQLEKCLIKLKPNINAML